MTVAIVRAGIKKKLKPIKNMLYNSNILTERFDMDFLKQVLAIKKDFPKHSQTYLPIFTNSKPITFQHFHSIASSILPSKTTVKQFNYKLNNNQKPQSRTAASRIHVAKISDNPVISKREITEP